MNQMKLEYETTKENPVLLCRVSEAFSTTWFLRKGIKISSQSSCFLTIAKKALSVCKGKI